MTKKQIIIVCCIFFIAGILRFWNLANTIPSLSHDEVAIGYNAWSILQTEKDEYGTIYPILFRSFDDYKLPGLVYTTAVSEKIFGLNAFAVRFPSAFFGTLTVIIFFFFLYYLLTNEKIVGKSGFFLASTATFMLAISPWHISFSRGGFEANVSLFFILLGTYFLFLSQKKVWLYIFSFLSFVVSVYFYYTARVLAPCIILVFFICFWKEIIKQIGWIIIAAVISSIVLLPIVPSMFSSGLARIDDVTILRDNALTNPYTQAIVRNNNALWAKIFYNRRLAFFQEFSDNYLKNFAFDFLFTNGDDSHGLLYLWEIPFICYGIYIILRLPSKWKYIFLAWFFITPVVGGLTREQPNALRTLPNAVVFALFSGIGIVYCIDALKKNKKIWWLVFGILTIIFFFVRFIVIYFNYVPPQIALNWGDGHKQVAAFIKQNQLAYDNIYMTGAYWRPYIYMLFYLPYPPALYQNKGSRDGFSNLHFGQAEWDNNPTLILAGTDLKKLVKGRTLFILSYSDYLNQKEHVAIARNYNLHVVQIINGVYAQAPFYAVTVE